VSDLQITGKVTRTEQPAPPGWAAGTVTYKVRLHYRGRQMTVPFHMGPAYADPPTVDQVADTVLDDVAGWLDARTPQEWLDSYCFADDDESTALYHRVAAQCRSLRRLLGDDFDSFMDSRLGL
jgi:hypothetical protein